MRTLLTFYIILFAFQASSQTIVNDWKSLAEQTTLKEYIENQAYAHLKFQPIEKDTTNNSGVLVTHSSTDAKLIIRDKASISSPETPLIVINMFPIDHLSILKEIKLAEIEKISLLKSTEQSGAIYGIRGEHGVILIEMNRRKWKKLKKEKDDQ